MAGGLGRTGVRKRCDPTEGDTRKYIGPGSYLQLPGPSSVGLCASCAYRVVNRLRTSSFRFGCIEGVELFDGVFGVDVEGVEQFPEVLIVDLGHGERIDGCRHH